MYNFTGSTIDELYTELLKDVLHYGTMTNPRGFNCIEMSPCSIELLDIQKNIITNSVRKVSTAFMGAELLWILMGRKDVEMISFYNSKMSTYSDDGKEFFGSYGPKIVGQLRYVIETLTRDPWSRQALINIWRENPPATKDVPCTVMMHFLRRPLDTLNMIVYMRSQDLWLGFPYDVHNFTCIQLIMASLLGCQPGSFTLTQGSLHLYEEHFGIAEKAVEAPQNHSIVTTPLSNIATPYTFNEEMSRVKDYENQCRHPEASVRTLAPMCPLLNQKLQWLQDYARRKHETGGNKQ